MSAINKVILMGVIQGTPTAQQVGTPPRMMAKATLQTTEEWQGKDGKAQYRTEKHRLVLWGDHAARFADFAGSGMRLFIEGRLTTSRWTDKAGAERETVEVDVSRYTVLAPERRNDLPPVEQRPAPARARSTLGAPRAAITPQRW
jgi:single-strand DNA-binding protein